MIKMRKLFGNLVACLIAMVLSVGFATGCSSDGEQKQVNSVNHIQSVTAIGFVDADGVKVNGVALKYDCDMSGASLTADQYMLNVYSGGSGTTVENLGGGSIGEITNLYVNESATLDENNGSGSGSYVILEVYTDYLFSAEVDFNKSLVVNVKQVKDITLADGTVVSAYDRYASNISSGQFKADGWNIPELDGWKYYVSDAGAYGKDGEPYTVENCFDQQTGLYSDVSVSYALWVPDDWHKDGKYAMVTLQNPAANAGTHPLVSVLQTRSPSVYASDWAQELVKKQHGVDGMIVVVPVVTARVNDNGGTPAEYEAIVHLWDHIIEEYSVDTNYIYGSGQSVGGMILLETNRNRDNFFAGLLLYEDQWAQNYYPETLFVRDMVANSKTAATATMHYSRTDSYITWDHYYDADGNEVTEDYDPYNYFYLVSDDNILIMNYDGNNLSINSWNEMHYLYYDLTGTGINRYSLDGTESITEQNTALKADLAQDNTLNINMATIASGSNGYSARKVDYSYEWLLSQSRTTEMSREKLDVNKPFEAADEQDNSAERKIHYTTLSGDAIYYVTGKRGAGTQFYNTGWYNMQKVADAAPGWLPDGMGSWTTTSEGATVGTDYKIEAAKIKSAQLINGGNAVAIEYDKDMSGLVAKLKGDAIIGLDGNVRNDITIELDPYIFFDSDGNEISYTIKNVYVNSSAGITSDAERGSGSGYYVIVEFDQALTSTPSALIQRTTLRTDKYIASAYPWTYPFG